MVNMMDAFMMSVTAGAMAAMKKKQEENPKLQYGTDEFGMIYVNGIDYLGDEYWELKYPVKSKRPTIIEKLVTERIEWHTEIMSTLMKKKETLIEERCSSWKSAMTKLRKTILPKKVQDWKKKKQAATVEEVTATSEPTKPLPSTSKPSQETINILPTAPEPELKLIIDPSIIAPMALPKPTWKIIYESPALPEPDPPLPARGASDTIQDTTEVQDRARSRIKRKTYRPNVKY